ncbi:ferritin-like protein [Streptomyces sp. NPDC005078]|uniref:ferritin-like domain-containing protein n=1 Tax=unclassified Streptomyces TaxID=2593676 RepID=UPI0033AFDCC0
MSTVLNYESNSIVELMEKPAEEHDEQWLNDSLQQAIMLELATLPPYLCGLWSIESPQDEIVLTTIQEIVFDEMSHLGLACNMLTTIGGTPRLADERLVPKYPGPLPGGVRPGLSVSLSGLSQRSLDMYSQIEKPDDPFVESTTNTATSIGAFYTAILEAFKSHRSLIKGTRQVARDMSSHGKGNSVVALGSFEEVEQAIMIIKEQGEGTSVSPENPFPGEPGELAHFYAFREIFHGRKLIKISERPKEFDFRGAEIHMPKTLPMGTVPKGGWAQGPLGVPAGPTRELLDTFNQHYSSLLRFLEQAWQADQPSKAAELLGKAVGEMFSLQQPARDLMKIPLPDGSGLTYGPEFQYVAA